ncbi:hypothetical protein [Ramlibacter sp. AN1133]|uniref:hypothetical protein n=1 Tax=Ramlibacter sp. AN1133 TaxID=3133429 RepID=UPI0030BDFD37
MGTAFKVGATAGRTLLRIKVAAAARMRARAPNEKVFADSGETKGKAADGCHGSPVASDPDQDVTVPQ